MDWVVRGSAKLIPAEVPKFNSSSLPTVFLLQEIDFFFLSLIFNPLSDRLPYNF